MNLAELLKMADTATEGVELNDGDYKPVPPGTYSVAVTEAEGPVASKRANPNNPTEFGQLIKLTLTITEGPHANRKLFLRNNIIVYPASMSTEDQKKAQKAMAMGARERKVILDSLGKTGIENAAELVGATFRVEVKHRVYNGKTQEEVAKVLPSGAASANPARSATVSPNSAAVSGTKAKLPWEK